MTESSPSIWRYVVSVKSTSEDFVNFVALLENINFIINAIFLFPQESKSTLLQYLTFKSNVFTNTKDSFWTFSTLSPCTTVLKQTLKTRTSFHAQLWLVARLLLGKLNSNTVKLDFKELLIKEQIDFKELFTDYQLFYTINLLLNKELLLI